MEIQHAVVLERFIADIASNRGFRVHALHMRLQDRAGHEVLAANWTAEHLLLLFRPTLDHHSGVVHQDLVPPLIFRVADIFVRALSLIAGRRLLPFVYQIWRIAPGNLVIVVVFILVRRSVRAATALRVRATVRRHDPMRAAHMSIHVAVRRERHVAIFALERSLARVHQHVSVQRARRAEHLVANAAAVILLAAAVRAAR